MSKLDKKRKLHSKLFHQKHLLFGYFVTYFTVMIVPYLLGSLYYHQTAGIVYEDTITMNSAALSHTAAITDIRFEEIVTFADQLVINPDVCSFQSAGNPFVYPNTYPMIELCNSLSANYSTNQMIRNYFLFFHQNEACITGKYAYPYRQLYEIYYEQDGLTYGEWLTRLQMHVEKQGFFLAELPIAGKKETCLTYGKPLLSNNGKSGFLLIALNEELFDDLFSAIDISDGGSLYIQDTSGNILYSNSTGSTPISELQQIISQQTTKKGITQEPFCHELTIDGQKMLVTQTTTAATHLTYVFVQRADSIIARANSLKFLMVGVLILSFILGTALCYLMSRTSSQPLNALLGELPPAEKETDFETAFERIHASWSEMASRNQTIEQALAGQLPYLRYTFLARLLKRDFSSEEEARTLADYIHFGYKDRLHTVLIFRISSDILPTQQMDLSYYMTCRVAIREALQTLYPDLFFTEPGSDQIVCLHTLTADSSASPLTEESVQKLLRTEIIGLARQLSEMLPAEVYDSLYIYVGSTVSSLLEIVMSYESCQSMFHTRPVTSDGLPVIWHRKEAAVSATYFYPYEVRANIIRFALAGEEDSLHDALHDVLNRNIVENTFPPLLFQMFTNDLESTLFAILAKMELETDVYQEMYQRLEALIHLDDLQKIHRICGMFTQFCELSASQNALAESGFIQSVTAYIRENYASPELSLTGTADHFHVNESYLSLSFKQYTGTNFSTYLETLRMEKARMLLCTTEQTIAKIAAANGYYSSNTFCRAFKRFWGFTPTQCRSGQTPPREEQSR